MSETYFDLLKSRDRWRKVAILFFVGGTIEWLALLFGG